MLERLLVENLVLVRRAEIAFGAGLTCLTGETGAGKTLLIQALGLIVGQDAHRDLVGKFGSEAYVEAEFRIPEAWWQRPELAPLAEVRPSDADTLVLARRVGADGQTRALAWGRRVSRDDLARAGGLLVAIAGQHSSRALMNPRAQRDLLDRAGDTKHQRLLAGMVSAYADARSAQQRLEQLVAAQRGRVERLAQIEILIEHVDRIAPEDGEEEELRAQRDRARHHAGLVEALGGTLEGLDSDDGPADGLRRLSGLLDDAASLDASLAPLAQRMMALVEELPDVASDVRHALEGLDTEIDLEEVERRLSDLGDLARRYGSVEEAVRLREELAGERDDLGRVDAELDAARDAHARGQAALIEAASRLTRSRQTLAKRVARTITAELAGLGMPDARVQIELEAIDQPGAAGAERVRFLLAANPGQELAPLDRVASGGELSRVALALQVALGAAEAGLVVFDEIDAGIGGTTAHAVAARLRRLAATSRVLCVTHLPQLAAAADANLHIDKTKGQTSIKPLHDDAVVEELCRMLGGDIDGAAREHASQLRQLALARDS